MYFLSDDIEDNSVLRRGIPVAHKVFGVPSTLNCGNYVMFQALERVLRLGGGRPVEAAAVFTEQMLELHRGQVGKFRRCDVVFKISYNFLLQTSQIHVFTWRTLSFNIFQGMEIYWRDNFRCPTEEEYRAMTVRKTGGLFNLAVRLMHLFSPDGGDVGQFAELSDLMGLYFQVWPRLE